MIDPELLKWLRCPIDGQELIIGSEEVTRELNRRVELRQLRDRADGLVEEPMDAVLLTHDRTRAYPIREGIPTLIPSESLELAEEFR